MAVKYMFNDADNMIDLARDIQVRVYWGGHFYLLDEYSRQYAWKDLWDMITHEKENRNAVGVMINDNEIQFVY